MQRSAERRSPAAEITAAIIELGLNHEQQHRDRAHAAGRCRVKLEPSPGSGRGAVGHFPSHYVLAAPLIAA